MTSKFALEDLKTMQNELQMDLETYDYYNSNYVSDVAALRIQGKEKNKEMGG